MSSMRRAAVAEVETDDRELSSLARFVSFICRVLVVTNDHDCMYIGYHGNMNDECTPLIVY